MEILKFLELGGSIMMPLILISMFATALIVDLTWINLKSHRNLKILFNNNKIKKSFDPVSRVMDSEMKHEEKLEEFKFELQKVERKTSLLSAVASISPMLGLLGTVFGMIKIFNIVSIEKPTNPLQSLSGGISEALFATAGGLLIAIISGFAYHFLISSLDSIGDKGLLYLNKQKSVS